MVSNSGKDGKMLQHQIRWRRAGNESDQVPHRELNTARLQPQNSRKTVTIVVSHKTNTVGQANKKASVWTEQSKDEQINKSNRSFGKRRKLEEKMSNVERFTTRQKGHETQKRLQMHSTQTPHMYTLMHHMIIWDSNKILICTSNAVLFAMNRKEPKASNRVTKNCHF